MFTAFIRSEISYQISEKIDSTTLRFVRDRYHFQTGVFQSEFWQQICHTRKKLRIRRLYKSLVRKVDKTHLFFSASSSCLLVARPYTRSLQFAQFCRVEIMYGNNIVRPPSSYSHHTSMNPFACFVLNVLSTTKLGIMSTFDSFTILSIAARFFRFNLRTSLWLLVNSVVHSKTQSHA